MKTYTISYIYRGQSQDHTVRDLSAADAICQVLARLEEAQPAQPLTNFALLCLEHNSDAQPVSVEILA